MNKNLEKTAGENLLVLTQRERGYGIAKINLSSISHKIGYRAAKLKYNVSYCFSKACEFIGEKIMERRYLKLQGLPSEEYN
ncbi:MAG: hypothetical protein Q8O84_01230 [Nanoarchaeota archaeon]|nr:hypothetical protein [Nanoarchaeota archaeon]